MGNVSLYIGLPFPKEYSKICGASDRVSSAISFRPSHISRAGYELLLDTIEINLSARGKL